MKSFIYLFLYISFLISLFFNQNIYATDVCINIDLNQHFKTLTQNRPIGINMNMLIDDDAYTPRKRSLIDGLKDLNVSSIRFNEGESGDRYLFHNPHELQSLLQPNATLRPYLLTVTHTSVESEVMDTDQIPVFPGYELNTTGYKKTVDFNDFINICKSLNISNPSIIVAMQPLMFDSNPVYYPTETDLINLATAWVRYANKVMNCNFRYWELGNEQELDKQSGLSLTQRAKKYAAVALRFAKAMKAVDSTINIGVNGYTPEWYKEILQYSDLNGKLIDYIDYLIPHQYGRQENFQYYENYLAIGKVPTIHVENTLASINAENIPNQLKRESLAIQVTEASSFLTSGIYLPHRAIDVLMNFEHLVTILSVEKVDYVHFWVTHKDNDYFNRGALYLNNYITPIGWPIKLLNDYLYNSITRADSSLTTVPVYVTKDLSDSLKVTLFVLNKEETKKTISFTLNGYNGSTRNRVVSVMGNSAEAKEVLFSNQSQALYANGKYTITLPAVSVSVIRFSPDFHSCF